MREEGFRIDSSVTPGRYLEKDYARYDFRMTPRNLSYWKVSNSITQSDPDGDIVEVPIFTDRFIPLFRQSPVTKKTPAAQALIQPNAIQVIASRAPIWKRIVGRFLPRVFNLDFCKLSAREMIRLVERARHTLRVEKEAELVPVVMTGHSKEWPGSKGFRQFLEWASDQNWIRFTTFPEWYEKWFKERY